jgi:prepilin signal peptidase PulO-like enzyme (type II secretory pathway)
MGPVGVALASATGAVAGYAVGPLADRIATPRYGPGTAGDDPEDRELALLRAPTSPRVRIAATAVTIVASALLANEFVDVEVWAFFAVLTWGYVVAAVVDLQYLRLPDVITWPAALVAVGGSLALAAHFDHVEAATWGIAATAGAVVMLFLLSELFHLLRGKEAFGLGDTKLELSLGASVGWLGWTADFPAIGPVQLVIIEVMAGMVVGSLAGLPAAGFKVKKPVPFGPFLMVGWFVVVLFADSLRG